MARVSNFSKIFINKKKKIILISAGLISTFAVISGWGISNFSSYCGNSLVEKTDSKTNALDTSTSTTTQSPATFTVSSEQSALNKTADQVTSTDLEDVLTPSSSISEWNVIILPTTETNLNLGYVNFLIAETYTSGEDSSGNPQYSTVFADASASTTTSSDGSTESYQSDDTISNLSSYALTSSDGSTVTPEQKNVFSTAKIPNLDNWITADKYALTWKSDDDIESYITNDTATSLTAQEVWNNLLDSSTLPPLSSGGSNTDSTSYTTISVSSVDANGNDDSSNSYGIYKVELTFHGTSTSSWSSGSYPTGASEDSSANTVTVTKYFGGFLNSSGTRNTITLNTESNIRSWIISDTSLFEGTDSTLTNQTVSTLLPTQFVNPQGGTSALISLFSSGTGLKPSESEDSKPIITYSYAGQTFDFYDASATSSSSTTASGGILKEIADNNTNIRITSIQTTPDNTDGSLQVILTYNMYSIYSGSIVSQTYTWSFPSATFATAASATETLILSWKSVDTLSQYGLTTSYDVVNEFNKNKDNSEFVRVFTNLFLDASSDVLDMDRTATVLYGSPSDTDPTAAVDDSNTIYNETTGNYTASSTVTNTDVTIRLTFSNWNNTDQDMVFQQSFSFPTYQYSYSSTSSSASTDDSLSITWKTNSDVITNNPTYANTTPSDLVYSLLSSGDSTTIESNYSIFFSVNGVSNISQNLSVTFLPDDEDGSITVYISKSPDTSQDTNAHVYSQLFVGFKKSNTVSSVVSYSWLSQDEVSSELLAIPLASVTKEDVMNYYLDNISLFSDGTLTEDDVEISPDISTSSLTVQVTMPFYNQESTTATASDRTFMTKITGFITNTYTNDTTFSPPKNLTAVISVSVATIASITLGVILICLLLRIARVRNFKEYHNKILESGEKKKKEKKK